jgi:membrane protein YdbS with pleckstrin-like domain
LSCGSIVGLATPAVNVFSEFSMSSLRPPAISGVSSQRETVVMSTYPSICSTGVGRLLGQLYESIPTKIGGIKISHALFCLPTAPLGVLIYFALKFFGVRYTITNRSIQLRTVLSNRPVKSVPLGDIADVDVNQLPGQEFFAAADITLYNAKGDLLVSLPGVARADVFRAIINDVRQARSEVEKSLKTIQARGGK